MLPKSIFILLFFLSTKLCPQTAKNPIIQRQIIVNIFLKDVKSTDTLTLMTHQTLVDFSAQVFYRKHVATLNADGYFKFTIPVNENYGFFSLWKTRPTPRFVGDDLPMMKVMDSQFWENGDSITMRISINEKLSNPSWTGEISGKGSHKYRIAKKVSDFREGKLSVSPRLNGTRVKEFSPRMLLNSNFDVTSDLSIAKFYLLKKYQKYLSAQSYNVIKASIPFTFYLERGILPSIMKFYDDSIKNSSPEIKSKFMSRYNEIFNNSYGISKFGLMNSVNYLNYFYAKLKTDSYLNSGCISQEWILNRIKNSTAGKLRESLILKLCLDQYRFSQTYNFPFSEIKSLITSPVYLEIFSKIELNAPGRKFADFQLETFNGDKLSLSGLKGKVFLVDFWFTGCGGCLIYYEKILSKVEEKFRENPNVVFLSVSVDIKREKWFKTIEAGDAEGIGNYTSKESNVVNAYTQGLGVRHKIITDHHIQAYPTAILVDKGGMIKYFNMANLYDEESLVKAIDELL